MILVEGAARGPEHVSTRGRRAGWTPFVGVEMGRQALASPPIDGTAAEMIAYANEHERLLRIFPWADGVGATCFLLFAVVLVTRKESPAHVWLA